ncbi:MT-A70 family methyltransferase [Sandaracinus amylolyticus]|uniref:Adenine-specific DNA methyltransferase n=1 Tax=Sandaracinus amylolyticus TaxID=927083 RepID=A0A0F6YHR1_9BACT|nr:MT-A70 family methyltransferase [Sandaracinus amylolyticus]AKF06063.1 Adenine-specific DNA methyltransferase [Sandaracinus amylolyticus]
MTDLFGTNETAWRCILMDPPWAERGGGKIKRGADRHYQLADTPSILRAIRGSGVFTPAANAHLWCWYTDNFIEDALGLVRDLGFRPVRTFIWAKTDAEVDEDELSPDELDAHLRIGIGQYGRGCHEGMIFAVRGSGQSPEVWTGRRDVRSLFHAPHPRDEHGKRIHSRKPPRSYELMESVSKGPRIEFFARVPRVAIDGERWAVWGNQAPAEGT